MLNLIRSGKHIYFLGVTIAQILMHKQNLSLSRKQKEDLEILEFFGSNNQNVAF